MNQAIRTEAMGPEQKALFRRLSRDVIVGLTPDELWRLACEYDGIDPRSRFVVFSDENPYT